MPEEYNGELAFYKVTGEIFPTDEHGNKQETALEIGSVQEVPVELGDSWVEQGLAVKQDGLESEEATPTETDSSTEAEPEVEKDEEEA